MRLDKYHSMILRVLGHYRGGLTQNRLFQNVGRPFSKPTFQKKLQDLIDLKFVERKPEGRQSLLCRLTQRGERRIELESEIEELKNLIDDENVIKTLIDTSIEIAEGKPLVGKTSFLVSKNQPVFTIAHFPSESQYKKLLRCVKEDKSRLELAKLINALVEFYTEPITKEGSYFARYLDFKERCFFMGFLPQMQSNIVNDLVSLGFFGKRERATFKLTRGLIKICFFPLLGIIDRKLRTDNNFGAGKAITLFHGCIYYDPKDKAMMDIRGLDPNIYQRIVRTLEATPPEEFKQRVLNMLKSSRS